MTRRKAPSWLSLSCASAALVAGLGAVWACASPPDPNRATAVGFVDTAGNLDPDPVQFKEQNVSLFLERRCGTLDCHGRPERPLRIYGARGLRLPNDGGLRPTQGGTSNEEVVANYRSVVGLEPELMSRVVAAHATGTCGLEGEPEDVLCPRRLLLISKPLGCNATTSIGCNGTAPGIEHKGGAVIAPNDEGYTCLVSWLEGAANGQACNNAANAY
jgi:hypothetical protein